MDFKKAKQLNFYNFRESLHCAVLESEKNCVSPKLNLLQSTFKFPYLHVQQLRNHNNKNCVSGNRISRGLLLHSTMYYRWYCLLEAKLLNVFVDDDDLAERVEVKSDINQILELELSLSF
jgi:hypothetical protein